MARIDKIGAASAYDCPNTIDINFGLVIYKMTVGVSTTIESHKSRVLYIGPITCFFAKEALAIGKNMEKTIWGTMCISEANDNAAP